MGISEDDFVTKADLELACIKLELKLTKKIAQVKSEFKREILRIESDFNREISQVKAELKREIMAKK